VIRRYARFIGFLVTAVIVTALLWQPLEPAPAILAGFDAGVLVFFISLVSLFGAATARSMRARSQANEPDHNLLILLSLAIVGVVTAAVWTEVIAISGGQKTNSGAMLLLATLSLVLAWLFANALGTIHYAHLWYLPGPDGAATRGLDFPGGESEPDYWDFAYYTVTLSMTFQVSDVTTASRAMRRLAIVHGLVAFLFNISVIALSVSLVTNVVAG
jgi:uncharacterized membrane protein